MMRIKRFLAGLAAFTVLTGSAAVPVFAYTGNETASAAETATEAETTTQEKVSAETTEEENTVETKKDAAEMKKNAAETGKAAKDGSGQPYRVAVNDDGTMTVIYNGEEFILGGDESGEGASIGTGKVANVGDGSYLNLRDGAEMSANIIGHLLPGTEVTLLGEDGDWYEVSITEQTGYVCRNYLNVVLSDSGSIEMSSEMMSLLMHMIIQGMDTSNTGGTGLTPDGNMTLTDDIGPATGAGQQFITLTTKAGNVFYLVIDRDDDGDENVHFLNLVDEADLLALMDEDAKTALENQKAAETTKPEAAEPDATGSEAAETTEPAVENEKKSSNWAPLMLLVIVMIGGVGGFLYMTVTKKKKQQEAARPDLDADYEDEDDSGYELPEDDGEEEAADDDEQVYNDTPDFEEDESEPDKDNEPV